MSELKLTPQKRIALYDYLAHTTHARAVEMESRSPALAAYYADIAMHYDKVARRIEKDLKESEARS